MKYSNTIVSIMRLTSSFLFLVSFLFLFYSSTINVHSKVLCLDNEKHALLDFKRSFFDPFGVLSNWSNDNVDCCANWRGVPCDPDTGHVTSLDLGNDFLESNQLRPSLLELQHLTSLDLSGSQFTMRIPNFIGSLSELTSLYLSGTVFLGEIPPHLGNLSKLQTLDLSYSDWLYADSLHWLSSLSSLVSLNFSGLNLTHAVDWAPSVQMLPSLSDFICSSCSLPPPILSSTSRFNFSTSLQTLVLSYTTVSSSTFAYLINGTRSLQYVYLDYMESEINLQELLESLIGKAQNSLTKLTLVGNNLNSLPLSFEGMMFLSLTSLDASSNKIRGDLSEILQQLPKSLTWLDLSSNLLNGVIIDAHFAKFSMLERLILSNNNFLTFNFSKSWVPPFQLIVLELSSCKVAPSFPTWILTQKDLIGVDMSNSTISGAIPDAFWDFSARLFTLNLSHNQISGMVPNSNSSLFSYYLSMVIDLSYNAFHGPIPLFLFRTAVLYLRSNKFSSFPLNYAPFGFLFGVNPLMIHLSDNNLSGTLPNWLFQCDKLSLLNLENNKLSGDLYGALGSQMGLSALHLSNNMFSGHLPSSMKNCTNLQFLELSNNNFSGVVPSWLGESLSNLGVLTLRSNNFSGDLPSSLCNLQNLQILDLSHNKISGNIPGCVHNFSCMTLKEGLSYDIIDHLGFEDFEFDTVMWKGKLVELYSRSLKERNVINLSDNLLRGEIPIGVTALKELRSLDLSRNNLTGSIPNKIGQLTSLEVLKLSSNRLCGEIPQSLGDLTFLGTLNLSNNNLSGRIPTGTQLQSFDPFSYAGNPKLCGKPLPTKCPGDEDGGKKQPLPSKDAHEEDDESFDIQAFLAALGMGFAIGFLGVLGVLHFNRHCRLSFFQLVNNIADKIFVTTSLIKANRAATM